MNVVHLYSMINITMKVQEIVIDESASSTIASLIGGLGKPVARKLGQIFGTERAQLVDAIAKRMASKGKWAGKADTSEAERIARSLGKEAHKAVKVDKAILDDAVKEANKVRAPGGLEKAGKIAAGTWKGTKSVASASGTLLRWGLNAAIVEAIFEPVYQYYKVMEVADQWLASGQIPDQYKGSFNSVDEWYAKYREQQLTGMISKMAVVLAGASFAKVPAGVLSKMLGWVGLSKTAGLVATAGAAGGALFAQGLKDSSIANGLANLLASDPLGIPTSGIIGGMTASALDNTLGAVIGTASERAKKGGVGDAEQSTKPPSGQADASAKADKDATSTEPAKTAAPAVNTTKTGYELAPNASPVDKWIDVGGGFVKDPKTGQIANRYSLGLQ